ncbi:MAG TPA: DUF4350 domain-containing protein [Candidatus Methylomirabilis sp.]|nr:DUF4350 domain-containing protein [Candidatus Methylomirabilis sp.]
MPAKLDRTDRFILIGTAMLVVALAIATALLDTSRQRGRAGYPSSYSTQWDGAKAAYLLLERLGYRVERWNESPTALAADATNQVFVLADPIQIPTPEETEALRRFLQRGGRILATGELAATFLPEAQIFEESDELEEQAFPALAHTPLTEDAKEISMAPPFEWHPHARNQVIVYGNEETAAVVTYPAGAGQVIWWGSPSPLTNRGIKESGNVALLLNSVGDGRRRILWDEYFHGARGSLWSYVANTPLPWVCAQLGLAMALILMTYSRRYGTIREPGKVSRLSPLEFVDTLGSLYKTAHAGSAAVRVAYQRLRFQLTRQLGLAGNAAPGEIAKTAKRSLGWEEEPLLGSLLQAERDSRAISLGDAQALELVQELHDYTTRLEARRAPEEKRKSE